MIIRTTGAILSPSERQDGERQAPALALAGNRPASLSFRHALPEVWDQGPEGSCTGHAVAGAAAFLWPGWEPSRRDPYWQGRNLIGMQGADGCHVAAVLKAGQRWGYLGADAAPYVAGERHWAPPPDADAARKERHLGAYWRLSVTMEGLQQALWAGGPVVVVVETDAAFNEAGGATIEAPSKGQGIGLHAVVVVGYDATRETFTIRNSWGATWGQGGHAEVSWLWLAVRLKEAWQLARGNGEPAPRPLWEMLWPQLFLEASNAGPSMA